MKVALRASLSLVHFDKAARFSKPGVIGIQIDLLHNRSGDVYGGLGTNFPTQRAIDYISLKNM